MIHVVAFNVALLCAIGFALFRGGAPERLVAVMMLIANMATILIPYDPRTTFAGIDWPMLWLDVMMLAGFGSVAAFADRYWPIWLAGLQLDGVAIHIVRGADPTLVPLIYAWAAGQIAYPMILLLIVGTVRHQRRLRRLGCDPDWSHHERAASGEFARAHR